ncbi:MMPL family transporter [Arsenicicoccus sp. MKL-02]|uniref:MMPL family transporter n=1 Tax=Arsenicicoccus cauae TaxID=2663847 RepID=A0A6I3IFZ3_9MICO|nr:MMPL family transporter [Arsenicicoccus cauae]MTB72637.1 MMPL family transporter [Arsenicicoccus cauae]
MSTQTPTQSTPSTHRSSVPSPPGAWRRLADAVTSRRGAWATLVLALLVTTALMGALRGAEIARADETLPPGSESARAATLLAGFPRSELSPVMVVMTRYDERPLAAGDLASAQRVGEAAAGSVGQRASRPIASQDGRAVLVSIPVRADRPNTDIATDVTAMRAAIAGTGEATAGDAGGAAGEPRLRAQVTGGPAFGADVAGAFDGADLRLLAVTVGIVAVLLLLTYRSPVLWLVPLIVVALADGLAGVLAKAIGQAWDLSFDSGIVSVLVFGAGTNYALLLISRYREELPRTDDHRVALRDALVATGPAVLASNVTVVLSLLTLVLAVLPGTRGLGPTSAAGLLVAAVFALVVLPAALAICGRKLFWPFVPPLPSRPSGTGTAPHTDQSAGVGPWARVARAVTRRPWPVLAAALAVAALMAAGLAGTRVGLSQTEQFRVASESSAGLQTLARHYPQGESAPMTVVSRTEAAPQVAEAARHTAGVVRVQTLAEHDGWSRTMVVGDAEPDSPAAQDTVRALRDAVHAVPGSDAVVGGQTARQVDAEAGARHDLLLVAPLILLVVLLVLVALLRAVVAPMILLLVNVISAVAAIGLGTWIGRTVFGFPGLDVLVPLLSFLFLVALGIDYTIFLAHRTVHEAQEHGLREGVVRAVGATGGVITSAGVVLAAVFAALGVLPLVTLGQLGLIVGLGVLVDTLLVRTLVVPAVLAAAGERLWWPRRLASTQCQGDSAASRWLGPDHQSSDS